MRRRLVAVLSAFAAVAALVLGVPAATGHASQAAAAACSAPNWVAGQWYDVGAIVRYTNGGYYRAKNANPGYDPIISTWYWEPYSCDGGGSTSCNYPNWVAGQWYDVGAIVKYTNGGYYRAKNANPGYDPIISTWYWEPYSCGGGTDPGNPGTGIRRQRGPVQPDLPGPELLLHLQRPDRGAVRLPRLREHRQRHRQEAGSRGVPRERQPRNRRPRLHRRAEHRELPALLRHEPALRLPRRPGRVLRPRPDPAQLELQLQGRR